MKKFAKIVTCAALTLSCMASVACAEFKADKSIDVISREEGSGTRGAFVELTGVELKNRRQKGGYDHRGCADHQQHVRDADDRGRR